MESDFILKEKKQSLFLTSHESQVQKIKERSNTNQKSKRKLSIKATSQHKSYQHSHTEATSFLNEDQTQTSNQQKLQFTPPHKANAQLCARKKKKT